MTIFDVLGLIGGLCLFLFGMNIMGQALERRAGGSLQTLIGRLTSNRFTSFLTGLGVTAIIQSSSATTVMAVGFVNSGVMTLRQSIGIIMGANIGTTVTAWILSLSGIESSNILIQLLKPASFTPVLALAGIILYMFCKKRKQKDTGVILLGFAVLMFGMEQMSDAVAGLRDVPQFRQMFVMFENPVLGVLVGALLTAIIQSSSASVGILQALTVTGQITYGAAVPIIMGQNIGTCVTAVLSSFGANRNAKRVAVVHLSFNIIGTAVLLTILTGVQALIPLPILGQSADHLGIAVAHSMFNIACTAILFPASGLLEKLACRLVPDARSKEKQIRLDDRFLATPALALESAQRCAESMAQCAATILSDSIYLMKDYKSALVEDVETKEEQTDRYEDILGSYLVKLSGQSLNEEESVRCAGLLRIIGDLERIGDHGLNLAESARELHEKQMKFTTDAYQELEILTRAVTEIMGLALEAFTGNNMDAAKKVEPLEEVVDQLKETLRIRHIQRLQQGKCTIEAGFIWADYLTNLERISDHCSNVAGCIIETTQHDLNLHDRLRNIKKEDPDYMALLAGYSRKYLEIL